MSKFKKVARIEDVPIGQACGFEVDYNRIVICNTGAGYYALIDECTHESMPLRDGKMKGNVLICPHHGARFDVTTGEVTRPPAIVPVDTFEVKVEDGNIYVKLD